MKKYISCLIGVVFCLILIPEGYAGAKPETSTLKKERFKGHNVHSGESCQKVLNHFGHKIVPRRSWNAIGTNAEILQKLKVAATHAREKGKATLLFADSNKDRTHIAAEAIARAASSRGLYRIDLSTVGNKYIGETEKNLNRIFAAAESCDVVLLFDEADALFGKRTQTDRREDRFINANTNHLLKCIEHFRGLVILATNNRNNLNERYIRMFYFLDFDSGDQKNKSMRIENKPKPFKKGSP